MSVVWLLRHAEAQKAPGQSPDDLFSIADLGLSPRGVAQARAAADRLATEPIEAIVASGAARALETARLIAERHPKADLVVDLRLAEISVEGPDYPAILAGILELPTRWRADPTLYGKQRARFAARLVQLASTHASCAVVSHALSIRAFLCGARGIPLDELLTIPMEHATITRCERVGAGWRIARL